MVYLDYAATSVPEFYVSDYNDSFFNPNSQYAIKECLTFKECEDKIKEAIGAKSGKIIFGGNASWCFEALAKTDGEKWLCSYYEHDCVYKNGLPIGFFSLTLPGIKYNTVCWQLCNNITGKEFDVESIGEYVKRKTGRFVCDATAGIGKVVIPSNLEKWCDCLVWSGHKIGLDNKQVGGMWVSDSFSTYLELKGTVVNGYKLLEGTPDLSNVVAFTEATVKTCTKAKQNIQHYKELFQHMLECFEQNGIDYKVVGRNSNKTPAINAIILPHINADSLCRYLSSVCEIYISPGHSACEKNSNYRVLKQYRLSQSECESTIRASFGTTTTPEDIEEFVKGIVSFKERFCND